jgi:hypothetical protein
MRLRFATAAIGLALVVLGVCLAGAAQTEQELLGQRAREFWEARVKGDWAVVYDYLSAGEREKLDKEAFVAGSKENAPFRYLSYKLGGIETEGDLGWVEVRYAVQITRYPELAAKEMNIWQLWRKADGSWLPSPKQDAQEVPTRPQLRNSAEEPLLAKRVDGFWQAKEQQDWGRIYEYCDPAYRGRVSREEFLQMKARHLYVSHKTDWVEVLGDRGRSKVTYMYKPNDPSLAKVDPVAESAIEGWIKVDGEWYRFIQVVEGEE